MYNLTVDEAHTFFVGDGDWLVHNCRVSDPNDPSFLRHAQERQHGDTWYDSRSFEEGVPGEYVPTGSDIEMRNPKKTYQDAIDRAFQLTGQNPDQFVITQWGVDRTGKQVPIEWEGPNGSQVSMDYPHLSPHHGPDVPHIGWEVGKSSCRRKGHIFVDWVPAGRSPHFKP